ncbi:MAG TPA: glycosyltransferase family 2 protein [Planctomycetaceae bacterium]
MNELVSIIIPTCCDAPRADALRAAVRSCLAQTHRPIEVVVAANGDRVDERLLAELAASPIIRTSRVPNASQRDAMVAGRKVAAGAFFCFLDDDDELLPDSIEVRLRALRERPGVEAVTGNGVFRCALRDREVIDPEVFSPDDLFGSLLRQNWNASCGTLFRSSAFGSEFFDEDYRHARYGAGRWLPQGVADRGFSWTFATAKLSLHHSVEVIRQPTYVVHVTEGSTSQSLGAVMRAVAIWYAILGLRPPRRYLGALNEKLAKAHHRVSAVSLSAGDLRSAWQHHLASLKQSPRALAYLTYTRHLVTPAAVAVARPTPARASGVP